MSELVKTALDPDALLARLLVLFLLWALLVLLVSIERREEGVVDTGGVIDS